MIVPPLVALLAWIPVSLLVFRRFPVRIAVLINFVGGWAVLPAANYVSGGDAFPYWILGTSLESDYFLTKATIVGFTGLLGVFVFDRESYKRFRRSPTQTTSGKAASAKSTSCSPGAART
jgi:hypothetical protein